SGREAMREGFSGVEFWTPLGGIAIGQGYSQVAGEGYFQGLAIETPLGGIRLGQEEEEMEWAGRENREIYREARKRALRRLRFLRHLATFAWVILVILVADLLIDRDDFFVQWVAAIWGAVLAVHFFRAFVVAELLGKRAERWFIDRELRRAKASEERETEREG
ncbi:MAG: 2TM domain-containing protein, partial [Chloroflexota bacterium]|nr:2TM domain-containing protein [Chloroflexota bacterium]